MRGQLRLRWKCLGCGLRGRVPPSAGRIVCGRCGWTQYGIRPGLGDWVAAALHRVGITHARYVRVKRWLRLTPSCRCPQRQASLNRWGRRIAQLFMRTSSPDSDDAECN